MLYTLCYYTALAGSFGISVAGITFYFNRPLFDNISRRVVWKGLEVYHDITIFIENIMKVDEEEEEEENNDMKDTSKNNILSYTTHDGKTASLSYIPPINDLLFYKGKVSGNVYYKRITANDDIDNLTLMPLKKQFIQVELKYDDKSLEIHEHLDHFYLEDNHILDKVFLKWYLKFWFFLDLPKEYMIHIIDKDVNIFTLEQNQSIVFADDTYVLATQPSDEDCSEEKKDKCNNI